MINVKDAPVDVDEMRLWANGYKEMQGLSWERFSKACGIPAGTLQPFCKGTYQGDNERIASTMFRFMQTIENRAAKNQAIPSDPGFFDTPSAVRIRMLLQMAHMGRITVGATGPGTGKTMTVQDYAERAQPVWIATMSPSTARLNPMVQAVARALGLMTKYAWVANASQEVTERLKGRQGLLVIDEAQHLDLVSLEELRSWHDATGVGICLLGNEELLRRIESGPHRDAYGRLNRRIAHRHVQRVPLREDVEAFCDAWRIDDPGIRKFLEKIALTPGSGGLGECKMLIEAGSFLASHDGRGLTLADLRDAQMTRATRWIDA